MTQGLDRRITLRIQGPRTLNEYAEPVPGVITEHPEWCTQEDGGFAEVTAFGGVAILNRKQFLIRWRRDVLDASKDQITIRDEYGDLYNVELINESFNPLSRRRFIVLSGIAEISR